ncbi:MAG: dTMP kinase [Deltaproteobacteria bacterium]|nr:dTMP kinase [Deltaproteobacteria bacterium]
MGASACVGGRLAVTLARTVVGRFIVLEGLDGAGTTTAAHALTVALEQRGHTVVRTAQPSDRALGRAIRGYLRREGETLDPRALALLFAADRLDHLDHVIAPALARGEVVVCDRYVASSWAYQGLACPLPWVEAINSHARWPDLTCVLTVPPEVAAARVSARATARGEAEELFDALALQRRVAQSYAALVASERPGVLSIDATTPIDAVAAAVLDAAIALGL